MTWMVIDESTPGQREVHVVPQNDLRPHTLSLACFCHPTPDVDDSAVLVHHSVDRREEYERGELKPS